MNTYKHTDNNTELPTTLTLEGAGGLFSKYKEEFLSKFKVYNPQTLFPPNFENLQKNLCPICNRKLYLKRDKSRAFCKSKVKDGFTISGRRLLELGGSLK